MEQKREMLTLIENLSENDRLELFNVEELETRLEMAAAVAVNGACGNTANGNCW